MDGRSPGRDSRPETLGVGKASCSPIKEGVNDAIRETADPPTWEGVTLTPHVLDDRELSDRGLGISCEGL
jgi:hypothetical protein